MLNRDKPVGQRDGHGSVFGGAPLTFVAGGPYGIFLDPTHLRAAVNSHTHIKIERHGWRDRVGQPHGRTGDKLTRKAAHGTIGLRNRGPYAAWHLKAK